MNFLKQQPNYSLNSRSPKCLTLFSRKESKQIWRHPKNGFRWKSVEFEKKGFVVDPNEKKKFYDFMINNVGIELKTSGTFKYKGQPNRLLNEIIRSKKHLEGAKHPDCWMFITVYNENMKRLSNELNSIGYSAKMHKTKDPWCVILVVPEQVPTS